jgi:hypothetical protein
VSVFARPQCGTPQGALAHQAAGEPWCGWCRHAERLAALQAEGIPMPPPQARGPLAPVSAVQAAANARLLDTEVAAYENRDRPARHLRAVS